VNSLKDRNISEDYCLLLLDVMNSRGFVATFQRNHRMMIKINTSRGVVKMGGGVRLLGETESKGRQNEYFKLKRRVRSTNFKLLIKLK